MVNGQKVGFFGLWTVERQLLQVGKPAQRTGSS
jgi:hypothetical protein